MGAPWRLQYIATVAKREAWKEISRLMDEVSDLQQKIIDGVRRDGATREQIELYERQIATRKARIAVIKREHGLPA